MSLKAKTNKIVDGGIARVAPGGRLGIAGSDNAPAVTRAMAILRLLAARNEPLGVNVIAKSLGLIPSTCLHILRALVAEEMVGCDPVTKLYTLDAGVLALAGALLRQDFPARAQSVLDRAARHFGVTTIAVRTLGLEHMVVVAICKSQGAMRLHVDLGSRFPALISATGRCIAAFGGHSDEALRRGFARLRWDQPPTYKAWCGEVAATRASGVGVDRGQYIRGITIVAVPVMDGARLTHCLVGVGLSEQITDARAREIGLALRAAAEDLSPGRTDTHDSTVVPSLADQRKKNSSRRKAP